MWYICGASGKGRSGTACSLQRFVDAEAEQSLEKGDGDEAVGQTAICVVHASAVVPGEHGDAWQACGAGLIRLLLECISLPGMQILGKPGGLHAGHCQMPGEGPASVRRSRGLQKLS